MEGSVLTRIALILVLTLSHVLAYRSSLPPTNAVVPGSDGTEAEALVAASGEAEAEGNGEGQPDASWMKPLQQYGWNENHLKNKMEHGDVTTFELGTPNYQILNPEDEPEFITEDQPQYQEMLKRLTANNSASTVIDMSKPHLPASKWDQSEKETADGKGNALKQHNVKQANESGRPASEDDGEKDKIHKESNYEEMPGRAINRRGVFEAQEVAFTDRNSEKMQHEAQPRLNLVSVGDENGFSKKENVNEKKTYTKLQNMERDLKKHIYEKLQHMEQQRQLNNPAIEENTNTKQSFVEMGTTPRINVQKINEDKPHTEHSFVEIEDDPTTPRSSAHEINVFGGARPFQKVIHNLS
ncbi:uncharacterized protein LOC115626056 [Scaptodrosophila lebanonensis]|uniref:Uncharacterized protein LOC115626056 n=1 Tax=Drosophila lebanonensis TaxID=7225 RepID=A0A6J2TQD3_DROLE|nr:uncharacterized protein LOC115626056 [Scaptodrosophila lebanonensis]